MRKILLRFILLFSAVLIGCAATQSQPVPSAIVESTGSSHDLPSEEQEISEEQYRSIFDFQSQERLTGLDGVSVEKFTYGLEDDAFFLEGKVEDDFLIYYITFSNGREPQLFGKLDLRQNMIDIYYTESELMEQYFQGIADGEYQLYPILMEEGSRKAFLMEQRKLEGEEKRFFWRTGGYFVLINYSVRKDDRGEYKRTLWINDSYYFPMSVSSLPAQEEIRQALLSSDLNLQNTKAMLLADNPLRRQPSILFYDGEKEYIMCLWDMGAETRVDRIPRLPADMLSPVEYKADYRQYQLFPVKDFVEDHLRENEYLEKENEILKAYHEENGFQWPPVF